MLLLIIRFLYHLIHRQRFKMLFEDVRMVLVTVNEELKKFDLHFSWKLNELGKQGQQLS